MISVSSLCSLVKCKIKDILISRRCVNSFQRELVHGSGLVFLRLPMEEFPIKVLAEKSLEALNKPPGIKCSKSVFMNNPADGDVRLFSPCIPEVYELLEIGPIKTALEDIRQLLATTDLFVYPMINYIKSDSRNIGSGGGWHRDSLHSHQFKIFILLSPTQKENGSLVYLNGTQKISSGAQGEFLKLRFQDPEIDQCDGPASKKCRTYFTGGMGDILVANTRAIHRGLPCLSGDRLMLTYYIYTAPPAHDFGAGIVLKK